MHTNLCSKGHSHFGEATGEREEGGGEGGGQNSPTLDVSASKHRQCSSTSKALTPRGSAFSWITLKMPSMMGQSTFSFFANFAAALH